MREFHIKEKMKTKRGKQVAALSVLLVLLALIGGVAAKYITNNHTKAEMLSSGFHISSNYLEETNVTYDVTDWGDHGITIQLFNFEKENVAQVSEHDITYKVTVPTGWKVDVTDTIGTTIAASGDAYTLALDKGTHILKAAYIGEGTPTSPVTVTVTTTAPYAKELTATFNLDAKTLPEYEVKDMGDYIVLSVYSNDYKGDIKIDWKAVNYSPDTTNDYMKDWKDSNPTEYLTVEENTTYELIFVENQPCSWEKGLTSGKTIQIGE